MGGSIHKHYFGIYEMSGQKKKPPLAGDTTVHNKKLVHMGTKQLRHMWAPKSSLQGYGAAVTHKLTCG
jgi:hypothetical protein